MRVERLLLESSNDGKGYPEEELDLGNGHVEEKYTPGRYWE
jgi:hypothetical protein